MNLKVSQKFNYVIICIHFFTYIRITIGIIERRDAFINAFRDSCMDVREQNKITIHTYKHDSNIKM